MTDALIKEVTRKIEMLLCENDVPYDVAVSALCAAMKRIMTHGWVMDEATAKVELASLFARIRSELKGLN